MSSIDRMQWFTHTNREWIEFAIVAILLLLLLMMVRWASQFWG
jgi:hypothetical protein